MSEKNIFTGAMDIGTASDLGGRSVQQDDVLISLDVFSINAKSYSCFAIFDGHGSEGHKAAAAAKSSMISTLKSKHSSFETEPHESLVQLFKEVNDEITNDSSWDSYLSGTTAVLAILVEDLLHVAHVGDSRLIIIKKQSEEWSGVQITQYN